MSEDNSAALVFGFIFFLALIWFIREETKLQIKEDRGNSLRQAIDSGCKLYDEGDGYSWRCPK